jgi:hypothetical protein
MNKFLKFLETKGYNKDSFAGLEAEKQAELQNEYLGSIEEQLDKTISKEDLDSAIQKAKTDLTGEIENQITDMVKGVGKSDETELVSKFKNNAEKFENNNKQHSFGTTVKAAALMTTANVVPNVAGGYSTLFGNYIDTEIGSTPKPDLCILPLITVKMQPGTEVIYHTSRYNPEGDAAFIAEGALKPLADAEWKTDSTNAKEVAVRWKFTKRLMNHAPSVVTDFMEHANQLMEQKMDDGALEGDGTGVNLLGITATGVAAAFVVPTQLLCRS